MFLAADRMGESVFQPRKIGKQLRSNDAIAMCLNYYMEEKTITTMSRLDSTRELECENKRLGNLSQKRTKVIQPLVLHIQKVIRTNRLRKRQYQ